MTKSEQLARLPPIYRIARAWKDRRHARAHEPTRAKRAVVRTNAQARGLHVLVETGTYTGETAWAMRRVFDRIETIELEPTLARLARIRFGRTSNVRVHEGDSAAVLPAILANLDEPALFWLDAHPCTDRAVRDTPVPLLAEIAAVASHRTPGHVILIDDMRLMGSPGYPASEELAPAGYRLELIGDVGLLAPAAATNEE